MSKASSFLLISALLMGAGACDLPETFEPGPEAQRHLGIVEWVRTSGASGGGSYPPDMAVSAPDTVTAGQPFQVTITTVGPNGCWRSAGAELAAQPSLATITPFDRVEGEVCTQATVSLPRAVQVRFDIPGEATLRVNGRRVVDGNLNGATERTIEKKIVVR